jgi:hypothetical protein
MAVHGLAPQGRLKILVSAVQSRPCPPFFQAFSERPFRAVTESSPELSRRLGLTLAEIADIVALRSAGRAPCVHMLTLLERKAADLEAMLGDLRAILSGWRVRNGRHAVVCPHIEAKGGDPSWKGSRSRSAPLARPVRRSSSTATRSGSAKPRTRSFSSGTSGASSST